MFDDPNLVSFAGLVPVTAPADSLGLRDLADDRLTLATDKGANAGLKVASPSLVGGMRDAHFITSRICGICGDDHATCSCYAQSTVVHSDQVLLGDVVVEHGL